MRAAKTGDMVLADVRCELEAVNAEGLLCPVDELDVALLPASALKCAGVPDVVEAVLPDFKCSVPGRSPGAGSEALLGM